MVILYFTKLNDSPVQTGWAAYMAARFFYTIQTITRVRDTPKRSRRGRANPGEIVATTQPQASGNWRRAAFTERRANMTDEARNFWILVLVVIGAAFVLYWMIEAGVRNGMNNRRDD